MIEDCAGQKNDVLSCPESGKNSCVGSIVERLECSYSNKSERFLLKKRDFNRQYAHIYSVRLMEMRKVAALAARRKWDAVSIRKTVELKVGERCCLIGTLYKKMELKPSILKELSIENNVIPQPLREKYISENDYLILEDEAQRVKLVGNIPSEYLITGLIIAVLGFEDDAGYFAVENYCLCGLPEQEDPTKDQTLLNGEDCFVAIMTGLHFGKKGHDCLQLQMLIDLMTGQLGCMKDHDKIRKVVRIVICGNSLSACTRDKDKESKAKYLTRNTKADSVEAMMHLDECLSQLASSSPVDIMPGENDPCNYQWPQQPLHSCMFPRASAFSTFNNVTNPYEASVAGVRILCTDGRNVNDIFRFSDHAKRIDIAKLTLDGAHIAPSAPDTLGCYPYYDEDPFIIKECPHVYVIGNQPEYQHGVVTGPTYFIHRILRLWNDVQGASWCLNTARTRRL
ncbi:DNA polymerase delta subunit 2-like isoform X2 [Xenia sp. Carnegie-2017]|uniref:DNA polymerase delta subunit 2-like isoform X2 n=1 Tax=Xenia sp. Carnegie-2017 TaxID=2897299 RepID=UPI001F0480F5|nr:DNA polymerase delta subunit 2-like isoform X2 [Xenia sp. Carnegie-2017]